MNIIIIFKQERFCDVICHLVGDLFEWHEIASFVKNTQYGDEQELVLYCLAYFSLSRVVHVHPGSKLTRNLKSFKLI